MEELKLLVESIANLPDLAIWVIAMYFFFKLAIVGSIFGIIRLFISKVYDYFDNKTNTIKEKNKAELDIKQKEIGLTRYQAECDKDKPKEYVYNLGSLSLSSSAEVSGKIVELFSIIKGNSDSWSLIHVSDINKAIEKLKEQK